MRAGAVVLATLLFVVSVAVPAFGGPSLTRIARTAARALRLAVAADKRSKRALAATGAPGRPGAPGAPGAANASPIDFRADAGTGPTTILNTGGLLLTATCGGTTAAPSLSVTAGTTVNDSEIHVAVTRKPAAPASPSVGIYGDDDDFDTADTQKISKISDGSTAATGGNLQGTLTYSTRSGSLVTVTFAAEEGAFGTPPEPTRGCWFGGWALHNA